MHLLEPEWYSESVHPEGVACSTECASLLDLVALVEVSIASQHPMLMVSAC